MAIAVKDVNAAAEKYKTRGQAAAGDYAKGVQGAGGRWQSGAAASEDAYNQGVQEAMARNAFAKGIQSSGGAYYEERAKTLGAQRFGPGVAAGAGNWAEGFGPYAQTLASMNLSPRGPKGDPRNIERAREVITAMRAKKVAR